MEGQVVLDGPDPLPLTGADLRSMRKRAGLTQKELAQRFGCGRSTIIRWERGYRYAGERQRVAYAIPAPLRVRLLLIIAEVQAERRQLDHEVRRRVQRLASA